MRAAISRRWCTTSGYRFEQLAAVNHMGLPRVPVPGLGDTMRKYLESVRGVCDNEEIAGQEAAVKQFMEGEGRELQQRILDNEKEEKGSFHFQEYWDEMYLGMRCPCPVNSNPYYIFKDYGDADQASCAARLIYSALSYWSLLTDNALSIEATKAGPLCMGTLPYIIATSRLPGESADVIHHCPTSSYIVVFHKGRGYKVEAVGKSVEELASSFKGILQHGGRAGSSEEIAVLTSGDRTTWWRNRTELLQNETTAATINTIDNALLILSLDEGSDDTPTLCRSHLVGTPSALPNRWWDKINLTVNRTPTMGLIMEHAPADGAYWNSWLSTTFDTFENFTTPVKMSDVTPVEVNPLQVEGVPQGMVEAAKADSVKVSQSLDMAYRNVETIGAGVIKAAGMPPDAFVQVVLQAAYYKQHGEVGCSYESASMRNFWRGRTDNIRGANPDVREFVEMVRKGGGGLKAALHKAVARHREITTYTLQGEGIDRHLLSLDRARGEGAPSHPIFTSPAFRKASTWNISTSNVTSPFLATFGFGPVTPHGYGIGYQLFPSSIPITVTNYDRQAEAYLEEVSKLLHDLVKL